MSYKSVTSDTLSQTSSVKQVSLTSSKTSQHSGGGRRPSQDVPDDNLPKEKYVPKYIMLKEHEPPKVTLEEYYRGQLKEEPLFADILTLDDKTDRIQAEKSSIEQSILVTGFGIRNLESLQNALQEEEEKRLHQLYKYQAEESRTSRSSSSTAKSITKSIETETEIPSIKSDVSVQKEKLEYLMGLETAEEEEQRELEELRPPGEEEDQFIFSGLASTKTAQKYLRTHRIFDFFQFIIAHLLSEMPENPITFILILLGRCLMYRSGLGVPPLLYEEKHILELFGLMDRMKTGYIELDQYTKGMATLGLCGYNKSPPLSADKMVAKEVFIEEALENETAQFEDLIKRKWIGKKPATKPNYSDDGGSSQSLIGPYFIPVDLLTSRKKNIDLPKIEEEGEGREGSTVTK